MPEYLRCTVTVPADSGLPADAITQTYHFTTESTPPPALALAEIANEIGDCYDAFGSFLSKLYSWSTAYATFYNLADPKPRVPLGEYPLAMTTLPSEAGTNYSLPAEVALTVSFEGNQISGEPQSRRRGRVYIGPWQIGGSLDHASPPSAFTTALDNGFTALLAASDASAEWTWCVHSPSLLAGTTKPPLAPQPLASTFFPVVRGWVDNAWDTQRRRGIQATTRTLFPGVG